MTGEELLVRPKKIKDMSPDEYKKYKCESGIAYYQRNRKKIIDALLIDVKCPLCGRIVLKSNLSRHKKTKYCENHRK